MIRGLCFEMPGEYGSYLNAILSGLPLDKYVWSISEDEVFNNGLFSYGVFTGEYFSKIIALPSYYVFFANIQAYRNENDIYEIDTYADFLSSKCELIIFIVDAVLADIYAKDQAVIALIKQNAENSKFENIRYITEENDTRTDFSVNG